MLQLFKVKLILIVCQCFYQMEKQKIQKMIPMISAIKGIPVVRD